MVVDELYDGPFCILSAVDGPRQRRLAYRVLEHDPSTDDVRRFLIWIKIALSARGARVFGITTDGSNLYPAAIKAVFGDIPHQVCEFHVLKDLNKAILHVVAQVRRALATQVPKLPQGRPRRTPEVLRRARRAKTLRDRLTELSAERFLFVRHHLTHTQRAILQRIIRQNSELHALRAIMDEVYRIFDRRCRTATALIKLNKLRRHIRRYKHLGTILDKLNSPNLEKALTFLDDKLLSATSNAVERGNRRYRKMQKSVYRVRTKPSIESRMALDLERDEGAPSRRKTVTRLHASRSARPLR